jgi:hypothetical protein
MFAISAATRCKYRAAVPASIERKFAVELPFGRPTRLTARSPSCASRCFGFFVSSQVVKTRAGAATASRVHRPAARNGAMFQAYRADNPNFSQSLFSGGAITDRRVMFARA